MVRTRKAAAEESSDHSPKKAKIEHIEEPAKEEEEEAPKTPEKAGPSSPKDYPSPPSAQATDLDKTTWQGFCEIESEPVYLTTMIKEMGVQGICVKEIISLDPEMMSFIPKPIYGLIMLYSYRDLEDQDEEEKCAEDVWFANQMPGQDSCATLAIINILMNLTSVDIGENLRQFKAFTTPFTPYLRGQEIANFEFIKRIHNSFAKKMDMLEADVEMKRKHDASKKRKYTKKTNDFDDDDDSANHFIAFVPIGNKICKLDGFDNFPSQIGEFDPATEDWLSIAESAMLEIMQSGADDNYSISALVQNPLIGLRAALIKTIVSIELVQTRLSEIDEKWVETLTGEDEPLRSEDELEALGIPKTLVEVAKVPEDIKLAVESEDRESLLRRHRDLLSENSRLAWQIAQEMEAEREEDEKAQQRKFDYGPVIGTWLRMLAENGYVEQNVEEFLEE